MKQVRCEMCGSTDFVKEDGFFICQSCGIKYSIEEAKKLMVEGTVKINKTDDIHNMLKRAFMHLEDGEWGNADSLLEDVLKLDINTSKAYLGKLMVEFKARSAKDLTRQSKSFERNRLYVRALKCANDEEKKSLTICWKPMYACANGKMKLN